ncbi:MAG: hypothetical protein ACXWCG_02470 [Flavitalea sp.]
MRKVKLLLPAIACLFILFTGCKKDINESSAKPGQLQTESINAKRPPLSAVELNAKFDQLVSALALENKSGLVSNPDFVINQEPGYRALVQNATAVVPTPCDANTAISQWLDGELADWNSLIFNYAGGTWMFDLPALDALIFENSSANQSFGINGEYTQRLVKTFKDLKRFWNIQTDDMVMVAMHGSMLQDRDKLIRTYVAGIGYSPALAALYADFVLSLLDAFPQYRNGNHPIFTFNAIALKTLAYPPYGIIPDKIVMGDGIMEAFTAIGFGDVAPQAILSHEFGHQIQFDLNLLSPSSPEGTRKNELMADAYAAYYLAHARGASMQWKRVQQFLQVFFNIGDCSFTNPGHHGTPTQRMAAAEWAYNLSNNAQKQGHILTAQEFATLFNAALPQLVLQ